VAGDGAGAVGVSEILPRLRHGLDFMPSPIAESPGLIVRDSFRYTETVLLIPPGWIPALAFLDGARTALDVQAYLTRAGDGRLVLLEDVRQFVDALRGHGFLDSEEFHQLREVRHEQFRQALERVPAHAGSAYPADAAELSLQLRRDFGVIPPERSPIQRRLLGVAAPHVSPSGGVASYGAAYRQLAPELAEKTFVILGTSHYGAPEKFGLTRKPYRTPLGAADVDVALVDRLARKAPKAVVLEDYCHAVEHSIEFQVVFLQQAVGTNVRILPILCGPLFESLETGRMPDSHPNVAAFIEALADVVATEGDRLFWVLGVDMSHIGARYGDDITAKAGEGRMREVTTLDQQRMERVCAGDSEGFVRLVQARQDELKWCGYSPFYTFLRSMEQARSTVQGRVLHYDQWNIDAQSVVSFAAMEFFDDGGKQ
jgi:AmmeMemoRadiSam system protein B